MRLIDADYLLDVLRVHEDEWDTPDETWRPESDYAGAIKAAPTIEAEPVKHGKWIPVNNDRGGHKCDICGVYASSWATGEEHLTNFCPNCGAKMDGDMSSYDIKKEKE